MLGTKKGAERLRSKRKSTFCTPRMRSINHLVMGSQSDQLNFIKGGRERENKCSCSDLTLVICSVVQTELAFLSSKLFQLLYYTTVQLINNTGNLVVSCLVGVFFVCLFVFMYSPKTHLMMCCLLYCNEALKQLKPGYFCYLTSCFRQLVIKRVIEQLIECCI